MTDILQLNAATTAVILIDLQRAIVAMPVAPHSAADVVKRAAVLADRFRRKGATIVYVHVDIANVVRTVADHPSSLPLTPSPAGAMEIVEEAGRRPGDLLVTKRSPDAFVHTDLEKILNDRGIKSVVVGGISTNSGVESTARTAAAMGFELIVAEDVTSSSMGDAAHQFTMTKTFPHIGRVRAARLLCAV